DDVITRMIARQTDMQVSYEDRIAELRTQVDRITSRQLLDQDQIEKKLEQMLRRQSTLESRTSTLLGLPDAAPTGSIRPAPLRGPQVEVAPQSPLKASPTDDSATAPMRDRGARLEVRGIAIAGRANTKSADGSYQSRIARLQDALNRLEVRQSQ